MRRRPLAAAVGQALPAPQQGFGLLGIIVGLALSAAVVGVAYTAYTVTSRESDVATSTRNLADLQSAVSASYMSAATFSGLSTQSAVYAGGVPKGLLKNGLPVDVWGGAIGITPVNIAGPSGPGNDNGYALTFEEVPASACVDFAVHGGKGFYGVNVNNASAMTGNQVNAITAAALCNQGATNTVQFIQAKTSPNGATQPDLTPCVPPAPQSQSVACPAGQISSVAPYGPDGITQTRSAFCNGAYGNPGWSPWTTVADTCAPICSAPTPTTATGHQSANCPAGQVTASGATSFGQTNTTITTYACPAPTGPYTPTVGTPSPWSPTVASMCAPQCVAPAPSTNTGAQPASCPPGQVTASGATSFTQSRTQPVIYACPSPQGSYTTTPGAWSAWSPTTASVCAPKCVAPGPSTASQTLGCPSGQTGSIIQQQTTTYSCPAPQGSAVGTAGAWVTVSNTCTTPAPPPPPATQLAINGGSYLALCSPMGSGGTWSCTAQIYIEFDPSGAYEVVRDVNTKSTTVTSGTWLPSGGSASSYAISANATVTESSNGTNGSVSFGNTMGSGAFLGATQTIGINTSFYYRAPSLPDNVSGGSGAETVNITIKNPSTGATITATVKLSASAYASGS